MPESKRINVRLPDAEIDRLHREVGGLGGTISSVVRDKLTAPGPRATGDTMVVPTLPEIRAELDRIRAIARLEIMADHAELPQAVADAEANLTRLKGEAAAVVAKAAELRGCGAKSEAAADTRAVVAVAKGLVPLEARRAFLAEALPIVEAELSELRASMAEIEVRIAGKVAEGVAALWGETQGHLPRVAAEVATLFEVLHEVGEAGAVSPRELGHLPEYLRLYIGFVVSARGGVGSRVGERVREQWDLSWQGRAITARERLPDGWRDPAMNMTP